MLKVQIPISQHGVDGFGHQILGIMSLLTLTNQEFDDYEFVYIPFLHHGKFEHIDSQQKSELKKFIDSFYETLKFKKHDNGKFEHINLQQKSELKKFIDSFYETLKFKKHDNLFTKKIMPRHLNNLDGNNAGFVMGLEYSKWTYLFDNAWSTVDIGKMLTKSNICSGFNKLLVEPHFEEQKMNAVVHLRGGDGATRSSGTKSNLGKLKDVIVKIKRMHSNAHFYIHTNDDDINMDDVLDANEHDIHYENTNLLFAFSQMCMCNILIVGDSSLTIAASYINPNKIIVPNKLTCADGKNKHINPLYGIERAVDFDEFLQ